MANVTMTYEAVSSASAQVKTHKENFDSMISSLTTIVSSLDGQWEGVAKNEFKEAFEKLKPTLRNFSDLMGRYSEELSRQVAGMRDDEERRRQEIFNHLSLD